MKKLSLINKRFIEAARNNQLDELKNLLSQGADIHANNDCALRWSADLDRFETVKFLVAHGANIHAADDEALRCSAQEGHLEVVKLLVTQGANIHADDDYALKWSAACGHLEVVKFLLTQGANIHANDDEALKNAASRKRNDVWQLLSAFIQEEKLLVAASDSMLLVAALGSVPVLPGASTWVYGTALGSVALVAASDAIVVLPQEILLVDAAHPKQSPKTQRAKI